MEHATAFFTEKIAPFTNAQKNAKSAMIPIANFASSLSAFAVLLNSRLVPSTHVATIGTFYRRS